jgi:hypothetical protein
MEVDPMNSIINVMSKLSKDESISIQYVVRSATSGWHAKAKKVVTKIIEKNSVSQGIKSANHFADVLKLLSIPESKPKSNEPITPKTLTEVEREMVKAMEEKNSKSGLDVNIRVVACAKTKIQAKLYLDNIASSFSEYNNYSYGNNFSRISEGNDRLVQDFIYRRFQEKVSFLLNTEELASIFHFPLKYTETPNILWLTAKTKCQMKACY